MRSLQTFRNNIKILLKIITSNIKMQLTSIQMLMWIDILRMINKWYVTIST